MTGVQTCALPICQIIEQMQATGVTELPGKQKEIVLACQEIMNGKVHISRD